MTWSNAVFWKIQCLDCGINADLLTDKESRIICRDCLEKHEFKEVENELCQDQE
jgi:ribosomal protein S27E